MDFKKLLDRARAEKKSGGSSSSGSGGGSDSQPSRPDYGGPVERLGIVIRACNEHEVAQWVARGTNIAGLLPSRNDFTSGTAYALEGSEYGGAWFNRIKESIQTSMIGSSRLVILKGNKGFGTDDYRGHLSKISVLQTASLISWIDLTTMSAQEAAQLVCAVIMNPAITG